METPIHVTSEIGKLKTVMVHRPGKEIENVYPDILHRMLVDDIPYLPIAQEEHDMFTQTLKNNGIEVLYMEDLLAESLTDSYIKNQFLDKLIAESGYSTGPIHDGLKEYLLNFDTKDMVNEIIAGVRKSNIKTKYASLVELAEDKDYPFYMDPMPNVYFTRDQQASIGDGITINHMTFPARQRESLFTEYIIKYNNRFANKGVKVWRDRYREGRIEGGDELVLSDHVMAIGVSQRTSAKAITELAEKLFKESPYDTIIAIEIPHNHAMMHLDTVFTMINYDQFTVHPAILHGGNKINAYIMHPGKDGQIEITYKTNLEEILKKALNKSEIDLIPTGGGDKIAAPREQWNDGSNTLAIAPGEVVTYDRNYVSNDLLRKHGILVHEVRSSELSRGRGGPRCMSCPLVREDLKK